MKNIILIIMLLQTLVVADVVSVDAQIQKIQSAAPQERVKLMNEFKIRISQMNREERASVIKQMQSKMHKKPQQVARHNNIGHRQMQNSEEILNQQNTNQHQVANQVLHRKQSMNQPMSGGVKGRIESNIGQHK